MAQWIVFKEKVEENLSSQPVIVMCIILKDSTNKKNSSGALAPAFCFFFLAEACLFCSGKSGTS